MLVAAALIGAPGTMFSQNMWLPAEWELHERVWLTWFGQGRRDSVSVEMPKGPVSRKIIWLEHGLIEDRRFPRGAPFYRNYHGGGANVHVDGLARFVNDTTVILPYISAAEKDDAGSRTSRVHAAR